MWLQLPRRLALSRLSPAHWVPSGPSPAGWAPSGLSSVSSWISSVFSAFTQYQFDLVLSLVIFFQSLSEEFIGIKGVEREETNPWGQEQQKRERGGG